MYSSNVFFNQLQKHTPLNYYAKKYEAFDTTKRPVEIRVLEAQNKLTGHLRTGFLQRVPHSLTRELEARLVKVP